MLIRVLGCHLGVVQERLHPRQEPGLNVYTYEDFHAGPEKFTTTNMFVVTNEGVLVADGQGSPAETQGLVDAIRRVTPRPITTVVIASDHGDRLKPDTTDI